MGAPRRSLVGHGFRRFCRNFENKNQQKNDAKKCENPWKSRARGFQQKLFSIVLKLIDKWEPPWNTQKTDKTAGSKNAKPLENQWFSEIKQNPENIFSGFGIWWTIRGSKTNRHLSTILGKEVIRIACRFVLKVVLKNALSPKNRMIYKGFRAPPTGFEPHWSPYKSIISLP